MKEDEGDDLLFPQSDAVKSNGYADSITDTGEAGVDAQGGAKTRNPQYRGRDFTKRVIETIPDGIIIRNRDGDIVFANAAAERIFRLRRSSRPGEVYETPAWQSLSIDGTELTQEELTFARVQRNNASVHGIEQIIEHTGGDRIIVSINASPFLDKRSNFAGVVLVISDITQRKRTEEKLAESERNYRELVENAPLGVYKDKLDGDYIYVNKAMADLLEYDSPEELMGVGAQSLYKHPDDRNRFLEELKQVGKIDNAEYEFITKNGGVKTVLVSKWLDGDVVSGVVRDMSDLKRLQDQLVQTQKLEGLGNIAAGVAHDFNNILGVILGYSQLLKLQMDPKKFERAKLAITTSVERGRSLVKQLLMFARKTETRFESLKLDQLLAEIGDLISETFPKVITLSIDVQEPLPTIVADATQIHQVLLNICVNARDAMPKGGTLCITARKVSGQDLLTQHSKANASDYVCIRITDDGTGMDETTRKRIFEPFFTTKKVGKGTGLGLSVVYGIIESHGAFIDVETQTGKGTTFTIFFPVEERHSETIELDGEGMDDIPRCKGTVLVIEDEEWLRELAVDTLSFYGYEILSAQDGEEGIEIFRLNKDRISVVISDLGLPKLSGEEVIYAIKRLNPDAKVIVASGYIDIEIKTNLRKQGVNYFIQKPYMAKEMIQAINNNILEIE